MEVIDLGALNEIDELPSSQVSRTGESRLGSGIELLMNEKKVPPSSDDLNLGELDNLENELSEISNTNISSSVNNENTKTVSGIASNLFGLGEPVREAPIKINTEEISDSNLGQATRDSVGNAKTWDGFSKLNEVPVNEFKSQSSKLSEREKRRKKRAMLKKLNDWGYGCNKCPACKLREKGWINYINKKKRNVL